MVDFNNPVLAPLENEMKCGIITDAQGRVAIVHEEHLDGVVEWVEYDTMQNSVSIVREDGGIQDLGIKLDAVTRQNLPHGTEVHLILAKDGKALSMKTVIFLIKDY